MQAQASSSLRTHTLPPCSGLTAANLVVDRLGFGQQAIILDTEADEPHIALAKDVVRQARALVDGLGIRSPLL